MEVSGQLHTPAALPLEKSQWIGGWLSLKVSLDALEKRKIFPLPGIEPQPFVPYPVAIPPELIIIKLD
jgi:hypothetical protein